MRRVYVVALALVVTACMAGAQEVPPGGFVEGAGTTVFPPRERTPAPAVTGETLDGEPLALTDLDGPVVVNFWASWCGPCAREAPHLQAIAEEYGPRGVHVVGVNVKDSRANAQTFVRDFGKTYPSWYDEAAVIAASFGGIGPAALPSTIILDHDHRVAVRMFGAVNAAQLGLQLNRILDEAGELQ
jgi:thiol-disulfide isomerase/thioredoxin